MMSAYPYTNEPSWCTRLLRQGGAFDPSYQDGVDMYRFLRSTRDLLNNRFCYVPDFIAHSDSDTAKLFSSLIDKLAYVLSPEGFMSLLDIIKIVHYTRVVGIGPEVEYLKRKRQLRIPIYRSEEDGPVKRMGEYMEHGNRMSRAQEWQYRLEVAITEAVEKNWYCLFGTYTVDPQRLPEGCLTRDDLFIETDAWQTFVKGMKREVAEACGYGRSDRKWPTPSRDWFEYLAVIEHGASGDHPHIHVVWLVKEKPQSWTDPTKAGGQTARDIVAASSLWPHGQQRSVNPLFISGSRFLNEGWNVPIDARTGEPAEVGSASRVAGYVIKYMTKRGATKKWHHRVKASRGLGLKTVQAKLMECSPSTLKAMESRPREYDESLRVQDQVQVPLRLMRRLCANELSRREYISKGFSANGLLYSRLTRKKSDFFLSLRNSVEAGHELWRKTSSERYSIISRIMAESTDTALSDGELTRHKGELVDVDIGKVKCLGFRRLNPVYR